MMEEDVPLPFQPRSPSSSDTEMLESDAHANRLMSAMSTTNPMSILTAMMIWRRILRFMMASAHPVFDPAPEVIPMHWPFKISLTAVICKNVPRNGRPNAVSPGKKSPTGIPPGGALQSQRSDSNRRPVPYEGTALPAELRWQIGSKCRILLTRCQGRRSATAGRTRASIFFSSTAPAVFSVRTRTLPLPFNRL